MILCGIEVGIPFLVGSAGDGGGRQPHVDGGGERKGNRQGKKISFQKLGVIQAENRDKETIRKYFKAGKIKPL